MLPDDVRTGTATAPTDEGEVRCSCATGARSLGSKWCVYDLINTGALKSIRLGRAIRVTRRALEEFLAG